jgi:hypothetical protein
LQAISDLWASRNQKAWSDALAGYWNMPSVVKKLDLERYMDELDPQATKRLDSPEWYAFLDKYFRWKFDNGTYLQGRLDNLKSNSRERLFRVKESLFAFGLVNIPGSLGIAQEINGLGPAGASGLLAVLFPKWFGTADKFVVKALRKIESLRERPQVLAMMPVRRNPKGKETEDSVNEKEAVLLIDIMRRKATDLNALFSRTDEWWTPRKIDKILWASPRDGADARCLSRTTS